MKKRAVDKFMIVKKYANRRLYDTESSSYITLERLAVMVKDRRDFKVIDAKTGDDITHGILTQIIMEEESRGQAMLPIGFLKELITLYGDSMQAMVPDYLEASMESFRRGQRSLQTVMQGAFAQSPFAELAKRNMAIFEAATKAFTPAAPAPAQAPVRSDGKDEEIARLRAALAALQEKIDNPA